ncbi:unnamed protein product [Boreogadus saida]
MEPCTLWSCHIVATPGSHASRRGDKQPRLFIPSDRLKDAEGRCGIPPLKPRPGRARGTVKDGVYHPHPPAGDGEHLDLPPNQRDGGHLAAGRRKARSLHKRGYRTEARQRQRHALTAEA